MGLLNKKKTNKCQMPEEELSQKIADLSTRLDIIECERRGHFISLVSYDIYCSIKTYVFKCLKCGYSYSRHIDIEESDVSELTNWEKKIIALVEKRNVK